MKNLLIFLLLYCQVHLIWGQTDGKAFKLNRLKWDLANAKSDTDRVLIYEKLIGVAPTNKAAVEYGQQGLGLAKHIRYDKGVILCGIGLGATLVELDYYRAIPILTETKQFCEKRNDQYQLVRALGFLGYAYNKFDFQKAQKYYNQCKQLMRKSNMPESVFPITTTLGNFYKNWGLVDSALFYLQKGYQIALKTNIPSPPSSFYIPFGVVYYKKGQSDLAMSYFRRSIATSNKNSNGQAYQGLALIYRDRKQLDSARFYARESLKIQQERSQPSYIIESANLLVDLYKTSNPAEALTTTLLHRSLKIACSSRKRPGRSKKWLMKNGNRKHGPKDGWRPVGLPMKIKSGSIFCWEFWVVF